MCMSAITTYAQLLDIKAQLDSGVSFEEIDLDKSPNTVLAEKVTEFMISLVRSVRSILVCVLDKI